MSSVVLRDTPLEIGQPLTPWPFLDIPASEASRAQRGSLWQNRTVTADPVPPSSSRPRTNTEIRRALARQRAFLPTFVEWLEDESGEQERNWEILKRNMNETRRALGQPPVRE